MAYPVRATAVFPTRPTASFNLIGARVLMREYHHEMCVLRMRNTQSGNSTFRAGTPIVAQWGLYPNQYSKFVGYVLWVRPVDDLEKRKSTVDVVCIGASYQFKNAHQRLFTDQTSENVIASLATSAAFDVVYDLSSKVWKTIASPGDTDWEFLVATAKRRGATLYMRNTALYCYDPVAYLLNNITAWPVLKFSDTAGGLTHITKAVANISDDETTRRYRRHRLLTVDPLTLYTIDVTEDFSTRQYLAPVSKQPSFDHFLKMPSTTTKVALDTVDSHGRDERFNQTLKIKIPGNGRIIAGSGLVISGYDRESDGLWYVCEAEHEVDIEVHPFTYWSHLTLLRDSRSASGAPTQPDRPTRGTGNSAPRQSPPVLNSSNVFVAQRAETFVLTYGQAVAA